MGQMTNDEIKLLISEIAKNLAAEEYVLSHEFALNSKTRRLDKTLLYTAAENLAAYALMLTQAAMTLENREMH